MGDSAIGWTNKTWNPVTGCSHVSPGCEHCYAEALSLRRGWSAKPWTARNAKENVKLHPERLRQPMSWRTPSMVFVNSMSDLFHPLIPFDFIAQVFDVMASERAAHHTFQVLTKRPERIREFFDWASDCWPGDSPMQIWREVRGFVPNVWLGASIEDARRMPERLPHILGVPAAIRFLSLEPLLGPMALSFEHKGNRIGWVIVGGESGPGYRAMDPAWAESIAAQCAFSGVPLFVKQDSAPRPGQQGRLSDALWARKEFPSEPGTPHAERAHAT